MSLKVLLADDNITAQRLGSKILTEAGHQVIAVSNGAAAVKKIASDKPELLILDVFMPGYSGLEVCEKVKNDPATAQLPVILTVTNMEPFNQQDGTRVRADGVMIKPFEATDLLAVVQKFEGKSAKAAPAPDYERTVKMAAVEDFKDASYEEWKTEATEEAAPPKIELPSDMASAPALGFDETPAEPPQPMHLEEPVAPAFGVEAAPAFEAAPPVLEWAPAAAAAPSPVEAPVEVAPPAELEFTAHQDIGHVHVEQASELEVSDTGHEVVLGRDPALVTDADEMSQFATKVGAEHPDEIVVGIAMPGLTGEAPPAEEVPDTVKLDMHVETAPEKAHVEFSPDAVETAEIAALEEPAEVPPPAISQPSPVEEEMHRAFAPAEAEAPAAVVAPPPQPELPVPEPEPTHDALVAQFQAELDQAHQERKAMGIVEPPPEEASAEAAAAEAPPAPSDEDKIAAAVNRALDKYKDGLRAELIATIMRELKG